MKKVLIVLPTNSFGGVTELSMMLSENWETLNPSIELRIVAPSPDINFSKLVDLRTGQRHDLVQLLTECDLCILNVNLFTWRFVDVFHRYLVALDIPFIAWVQTTGAAVRFKSFDSYILELKKKATREILSSSNCLAIVANSNAVRTSIEKFLGNDLLQRIEIIHNGVDLPETQNSSDTLIPETDFLYWGRLSEEKGLNELMQAVRVMHREGLAISLNIIGNGPVEVSLHDFVLRENLKDYVRFFDYQPREKMHAFAEKAKAIVIPSYTESFCNVAVEALLLFKPIVASDVEGMGEILKPVKSVKLVKPMDSEDLKAGMLDMMSNYEQYAFHIDSSYRYALGFSPTVQAEKFDRLVNNVLQHSGGKRKSPILEISHRPCDFLAYA